MNSTPSTQKRNTYATPGIATPGFLSQTPSMGSQQQPQADRSLIPCTIKQLQKYEDDGKLHGRQMQTVCLIAEIRSCDHKETSVELMIDDSTGVVSCTWWANNSATEQLSQGNYFRFYGRWTKDSFLIHAAMPLKSRNAITLHLLDVMYSHHIRSQQQNMSNNTVNSSLSGLSENMKFDDTKTDVMDGVPEEIANLDYGTQISKIIRACTSEQGVSIDDIIKGTGLTGVDTGIKKSVNQLLEEGFIYSTTDDEHFSWAQ